MDDLELQRLKAVADAVRVVRKAANVASAYGTKADRSDYIVEIDMPAQAWEALADALNVLDKEKGALEIEYSDGTWATTGSDSNVDVVGYWHFPSPGVSGKDEPKEPALIVSLGEGYLVEYGDDLADQKGFTDRVDAAEWLLDWLGFEDEIVESVQDILGGLWDCDELVDRAARLDARGQERLYKMQDVAKAAQAYIEIGECGRPRAYGFDQYDKLAKAVKKWRGIEGG